MDGENMGADNLNVNNRDGNNLNVDNHVDNLKKNILAQVEEYYYFAFAQKPILGINPIPPSQKKFDAEELKILVEAALDGWWTEGRFAKAFERKLREFMGVKFASITNSGSSANLVAFMALTSKKFGDRRIQKGDEVIAVASCFPTTVNPIIQAGAVPVFLDVERETYNIDCHKLEEAITAKTKAIFLAHTLGNPFNLQTIKEAADRHKLWLIEDCCDALGSRYDGKLVGTFGDLSTFSFYPAHHITMGEGGAVITNNPSIDREVRSFRDWGRDCWCMPGRDNTCGKRFEWQLGKLPQGYDHKYIYSNLGYNLKVTDMQAALGLVQLEKLPTFINQRKYNFAYLKQRLDKYHQYLELPKATERSDPAWFGFLISMREGCGFSREEVTHFLNKKKIGTRLLFAGNITKQPYFEELSYRVIGNLDNTDYVMKNTFWIGVHPNMQVEQLDYIVQCFEDFFSQEKK